MPLDFPDSPSTNDTYTSGGRTWRYDGTKWRLSGSTSRPTVPTQSSAPVNPSEGDAWVDSDTGNLFVYYDGFWVAPGLGTSVPTGTPGSITPDATAAEGSSTSYARADHAHAIAAASAGTITGTNAEGSSTSFARADHNHEIQVSAWTTVTSFSNGWTDGVASGFAPVSYHIDALGVVRLRGFMNPGTVGQTAFTLPSGYRPALRELFTTTTDGGGGAGRLDILANGEVRPVWPAGAAIILLSGITFSTK